MLDKDLMDQLKNVFSDLEHTVELAYTQSSHEKQNELVEMLEDVASTSSYIATKQLDETRDYPFFQIYYKGKQSGISFLGIPGGHEFTSLILAILNIDGKGKLPDTGIINRIKALKGPIRLETFVSLSCENCPEVVQALNLMAILHDDFQHQMVDGQYVQQRAESLKLGGVPSVIADDQLVSAGKMSLTDIITKLEKRFGAEQGKQNLDLGHYDVAVIGGGPAGASAAIYSARKGLKVAVLADKIGGQVQETKGIENLISVSYTEGPQLAAQLLKHMQDYPIDILEHRRVEKITQGLDKLILLESGESLKAKNIIVATGAKWRELNVPGEKDFIGRGVAYCPHCDGPYYKGKTIAVVGGGNSGIEAAIDLAGIVKEVTVLEFADSLKADEVLVKKLKSLPNVHIITNAQTKEVINNSETVTGLKFLDRLSNKEHKIDLDGVFVQIGLVPNSEFIQDVVETTKFGEILIDEKGRTTTKGIYAAGDVTTTPYKQIIISMGEGAKAALACFEDQMREG